MSGTPLTIKRALLSVTNKAYLEELARTLLSMGVEIIATDGTAERLQKCSIKHQKANEFFGIHDDFDGRIKTVDRKLLSSVLFDKNFHTPNIPKVDLVVCNFYRFMDAQEKGVPDSELVDHIDIGGPTLVRAAAKNYQNVLVLVDPSDYAEICTEMRMTGGAVSFETRKKKMLKAFSHISDYDRSIFECFAREKIRYGENPHQSAFLVSDPKQNQVCWQSVDGLGLELSYNNILDGDVAYRVVSELREVSGPLGVCVVVKHGTPCGMGMSSTLEESLRLAWNSDSLSLNNMAFTGGVIAFSSQFTLECARAFEEKKVEVILAPSFEDEAIRALRLTHKNLRILQIRSFDTFPDTERKKVISGTLVQTPDFGVKEEFRLVTKAKFKDALLPAAKISVILSKWIKSNAVTIVRALPDGSYQLLSHGAGQPNRMDSLSRLAIPKAEILLKNDKILAEECVLSSDGFFPLEFAGAGGIDACASAGINYLVQPGGSEGDAKIISRCDELGISMLFTSKRHFKN